MPRYYFDVHYGATIARDDEGSDFPNLVAAEKEARQALGEIVRDMLRGSAPPPVLSINIRDASEQHLLGISLTYSVVANAPQA